MAVEDFTTYTEVDTNAKLTVTSARATGVDVDRDEDVYLYKDFGAAYFNALNITFELLVNATSTPAGGSSPVGSIAITNTVNDISAFATTDISAIIGEEGVGAKIWLQRGAGVASDVYICSLDTIYYCLLERASGNDTVTLKIYSDAARTTLLDTLTVIGYGTTTYRYLFGFVNWNNGQAGADFDGYVENLNLIISTAAPSATTQAVTAIDKTTATGNGNVTNRGDPLATQHGHVWATFPNPTTADSKTQNGVPAATGAYTSAITGLTPNTLYYCRAYITNSIVTSYGAQVTFTTLADVPVVTTNLVEYIAATTAWGAGSIDNNGGSPVTQYGVCWSTLVNPTTADSKTTDGASDVIGDFLSLMTGLTAATLYHVRAYGTNSTGTGYGADVTFTTQAAGAPIVTTELPTNIQTTNATGNGTIVDIGGSAVTEHGHCWGTSVNPTTADSKTTKGAGAAGAFISSITGLTAGTVYYTRAYATNSYGTGYGNNKEIHSALADEEKGVLAVVGEELVYTSKTAKRRALLGREY